MIINIWSQAVNIFLHSDTLTWFWAKMAFFLLLNAVSLAKKHQIPIFRLDPTIYHISHWYGLKDYSHVICGKRREVNFQACDQMLMIITTRPFRTLKIYMPCSSFTHRLIFQRAIAMQVQLIQFPFFSPSFNFQLFKQC
jgi:hypothetical protein